jgi:elongation factor Ts
MANQALNFDTKEVLASDFNGITMLINWLNKQVLSEKIRNHTFEKLEGAFIGSYIHSGKSLH